MKFYNLLLEILDDSVFKQKLDTIPEELQPKVIAFVEKLSEEDKKQFKSLLNKYSSVSQLQPPKGRLEKEIENLVVTGIGPGEVLFHLQLKNSSMVGDTTHDLTVGSEVYEVKRVKKEGGPFRSAKKGKLSKFKFSSNLYKMITIVNGIADRLSEVGEDIKDVSPELFKVLKGWNEKITTAYSAQEAILAGELSQVVRNYIINAINTIKQEIEKNTDDEFTTVRFGGVNISPKDKGIEPIKIDKIDGDTITLDFIGRDVLTFLEVLNDFPYVSSKDGDIEDDINDALDEVLESLPSLIVFSNQIDKLVVIPKDRIKDEVTLSGISQGEIRLKVKKEFWK